MDCALAAAIEAGRTTLPTPTESTAAKRLADAASTAAKTLIVCGNSRRIRAIQLYDVAKNGAPEKDGNSTAHPPTTTTTTTPLLTSDTRAGATASGNWDPGHSATPAVAKRSYDRRQQPGTVVGGIANPMKRVEINAAAKQYRKQTRMQLFGTGLRGNVMRVEGIEISFVLFPPKEDYKPAYIYSGSDSQFIMFRARGDPRTWKGFMPRADGFHRYTLQYAVADGRGGPINAIKKVERVVRIPLTKGLVHHMLTNCSGYGSDHAMALVNSGEATSIASDAPISLRVAARSYWSEPWFGNLIENMEYFAEWCIDELCPPYRRDALAALGHRRILKLAHMACNDPWHLCFWWMSGEMLLEELTLRQAAAIAEKTGATLPEDAKVAVSAYCGRPFGDARDAWRSYVSIGDVKAIDDGRTLRACVKTNVAKIVYEPRPGTDVAADAKSGLDTTGMPIETHVYAVGDIECETQLADAIIDVTTSKTREDAKMRAHRQTTLVCESSASTTATKQTTVSTGNLLSVATEEQLVAINAALSRRLHIVTGKPGTGKTNVVLAGIVDAFRKRDVVAATFTGTAAENLKAAIGRGVTAHRIVTAWWNEHCPPDGPSKYRNKKVLVIDEGSMLAPRLALALLRALGRTLARIYIVGDHRQLPPPGGGASLMGALLQRYAGTPLVSSLKTSMRVTDASGAFLRNLDRICEKRLDDGFEWSPSPESGHPFVFVRRGPRVRDDVAIVRDVLMRCGIDADSSIDWNVCVDTNDLRREFSHVWFETSPVTRSFAGDYREHDFVVGERVMFTKNVNKAHSFQGKPSAAAAKKLMPTPHCETGTTTTASASSSNDRQAVRVAKTTDDAAWIDTVCTRAKDGRYVSCCIMNGTVCRIVAIFDEDPDEPGQVAAVVDTTWAPRRSGAYRRWLLLETNRAVQKCAVAQSQENTSGGNTPNTPSKDQKQDKVEALSSKTATTTTDVVSAKQTTAVCMGESLQSSSSMAATPTLILISIDHYGLENVERVPPVTIDKMQGKEVGVIVVLMRGHVDRLGWRGVYTACSRGKRRCIVVADMDQHITPESGKCPSHDFMTTATSDSRVSYGERHLPCSRFYARFPKFADIDGSTLAAPQQCSASDSGEDDDEEESDSRTTMYEKRRLQRR
jgi:hypothetical protein